MSIARFSVLRTISQIAIAVTRGRFLFTKNRRTRFGGSGLTFGMDISDIVDNEFDTLDASTTVAKLRGAFRDPRRKAIPIMEDGALLGIITRRDVMSSHLPSSMKARKLFRSVPHIDPAEDVREVARLMIAGDSWLLPVMQEDELSGVLRVDDLLRAVQDSLEALDAADVMTTDVVSVSSETSLGRTLATFRDNGVRHLPVLDQSDDSVVGIVSLHDVLAFVTRELQRSQGGQPSERIEGSMGHPHGGFGARDGDRDDLLTLPVRNVMTEPVVSISPDVSLDEVVEEMLGHNASSVLIADEGVPRGIVTTTDLLEALTWEDEQPFYIHVFGADRMSETTWEFLSDQIESVVTKDRSLGLLEAKVHFHYHKETLRGRPLVFVRIRLFTDRGMFVGTEEGFGDRHAFSLALDTVERQILDAKRRDWPEQPVSELTWASAWEGGTNPSQ